MALWAASRALRSAQAGSRPTGEAVLLRPSSRFSLSREGTVERFCVERETTRRTRELVSAKERCHQVVFNPGGRGVGGGASVECSTHGAGC